MVEHMKWTYGVPESMQVCIMWIWPWLLAHWFYLLLKLIALWKYWCVDNACTMNDSFIIDDMNNGWIPFLIWIMVGNDWIVGKLQFRGHFMYYWKCAWVLKNIFGCKKVEKIVGKMVLDMEGM